MTLCKATGTFSVAAVALLLGNQSAFAFTSSFESVPKGRLCTRTSHGGTSFVVLQSLRREQAAAGIRSPLRNEIQNKGALQLWGDENAEMDTDVLTTEKENPFTSFLSSLLPKEMSNKVQPLETEEEKAERLEIERRMALAEGEVLRQERVREDALPYLALFALQLLPLFGSDRILSVIYFFGLAVTTVYVGGRQVTLDDPELVSQKNALYAPLGASVSIVLLYLLLKVGIDPTGLYAIGATLFGAFAISDVSVPILRNMLPESFAKTEIDVPKPIAKALDLNPPTLPLDGVSTLAIGLFFALIYFSPVAMTQKFLVSNVLAWALAMVSLGAISIGSFQTGALLLGGLFFYDIFWVFGTDVMMTVATKVEAPIKFLFTAPPNPDRAYPFSVLGLGDVVIPGIFVRFMSRLDEVLKPQTISYFAAATAAYAIGLMTCFGVNELTHAGQPALLYLDPACIGSAIACGVANGQLQEVWNFAQEEEEEDNEEEPETS